MESRKRKEVAHGTANAYSNHGCRCDACREANTKHVDSWRKRYPDHVPKTEIVHGTPYAYESRQCRCDSCKEAASKKLRDWRAKNPDNPKYRKRWYDKLRKEVLDHYGAQCACCGEKRFQFLALDHKNGDGNKHRKELGSKSMYAWAKSNDYPEMFQVLCHCCNMAKGFYGACPHESERTADFGLRFPGETLI